jgi:hypothetical protein
VTLYHGNNSSSFSANFKSPQPAAWGAVFGTIGTSTTVGQVIGPGPNLTGGTFWLPEPPAYLLAILSLPPLAIVAMRRKVRRRGYCLK